MDIYYFSKVQPLYILEKFAINFIMVMDFWYTNQMESDFMKATFKIIANMAMDWSILMEIFMWVDSSTISLKIRMEFLFGVIKIFIMVALSMEWSMAKESGNLVISSIQVLGNTTSLKDRVLSNLLFLSIRVKWEMDISTEMV